MILRGYNRAVVAIDIETISYSIIRYRGIHKL